jgi:hypothetical protein
VDLAGKLSVDSNPIEKTGSKVFFRTFLIDIYVLEASLCFTLAKGSNAIEELSFVDESGLKEVVRIMRN